MEGAGAPQHPKETHYPSKAENEHQEGEVEACHAAPDGFIVGARRAAMLKNPAEKMCRWCKDRVATVQHIVCGCCITRKKHIELHDNIAFAIFRGLQRNMVCFLHMQTETTTLQQPQATTSSSDPEQCFSRTNGTTPLHASQMLSSSTKREGV